MAPAKSTKLVEAVRELLWSDWDPIGMNELPEDQDEYDSYADAIANMVARGATHEELSEHLWRVETQQMGLPGNRKLANSAAQELVRLSPKRAE